jgi:hypothetical protein
MTRTKHEHDGQLYSSTGSNHIGKQVCFLKTKMHLQLMGFNHNSSIASSEKKTYQFQSACYDLEKIKQSVP